MNNAAKEELIKDASTLAYNHLKHSGAFKEMENGEWDAMSDALAKEMFALLEDRVNDFLTKKEAESVPV